jgi:hypothetical protein
MNSTVANQHSLILAALLLGMFTASFPSVASAKDKPPPPLTLFEEFQKADAVVVAHVLRLRDDGEVEFSNDEILKVKDSVKDAVKIGAKSDVHDKVCHIRFGEVSKDKVYFYRSVWMKPGSGLKEYVLGAIQLKDKKNERFRHWFDYLDSKEEAIAEDAHRELVRVSAKELAPMAKTLPADKIAAWLRDARTDAGRRQFHGFLLGFCGTAEHGKMLRSMIGESVRSTDGDITGFLKGHVMLQPKEGWDYVRLLLADDTQPYRIRLDAMHAANFLRSDRSDLIDSKALTDGVSLVLDHPDLAARGVDFLRRVKAWDRTDQVLALYDGKKKLEMPLRGIIVCFALQSPEPRALAFVKELRTRDPNFVAQMEAALEYAADSAGSEYIFDLLK